MKVNFLKHEEEVEQFFGRLFQYATIDVGRHSIELDDCVRLEYVRDNDRGCWEVRQDTGDGWEVVIQLSDSNECFLLALDVACSKLASELWRQCYTCDKLKSVFGLEDEEVNT